MTDEMIKEAEDIIFSVYGERHQKLKLCEECAELIQAILKGDEEHIAEEMADVMILLGQFRHISDSDTVKMFIDMKLARQLARIWNQITFGGITIPEELKSRLKHLIVDVVDESAERSKSEKSGNNEKCDPTDWD